jgi:hypothetical protein
VGVKEVGNTKRRPEGIGHVHSTVDGRFGMVHGQAASERLIGEVGRHGIIIRINTLKALAQKMRSYKVGGDGELPGITLDESAIVVAVVVVADQLGRSSSQERILEGESVSNCDRIEGGGIFLDNDGCGGASICAPVESDPNVDCSGSGTIKRKCGPHGPNLCLGVPENLGTRRSPSSVRLED